MGRRSISRRDIFLAIIGFIVGIFILLIWLSPRVSGPETEDLTLSAREPISITLNQPVDLESLRDHFSISPQVSGTLDVSGRQVVFQPDQPFEYNQSYTVSINPGTRGRSGLPGLVSSTFDFKIDPPRLLFLRELDGRSNIWRRQASGELVQLTDEPVGVWDFQPAPDSQGILYSSLAPDGASDLIFMTNDGERLVILECPGERCSSAQWQPGGRFIAFERVPLEQNRGGPAEIWILDTDDGDLVPAYDPNMTTNLMPLGEGTHSPRWSADGRFLSFYQPDARVIVIRDMVDASSHLVPANLEIMGGWSPTSPLLAYSELAIGEEFPADHTDPDEFDSTHPAPGLYNHITLLEVATEGAKDLTLGQELDFGRPAWHPNGESLSVPGGSRGLARQIWTLAVAGDQATELTRDPKMNHSSLAWSQDGRLLAFMGNDRGESGMGPAVWLLEAETGEVELVLEGAYLPAWQP